jgi:3-oxoadipate enol-lactonase
LRMVFAELDGLRIHYELSGDAGKPLLVLSHSLGVAMAMWDPQLDMLGSHYRLLRYDTRGHGRSSVAAGSYSIHELAEDVLRLMDLLGIRKASFCGISMGGVVGQWLGIHASNRLEKLVLANTAAKIGSAEIWNGRIATVLAQGLEPVIEGTLERWFTAEFSQAHPEVVGSTRAMLGSTEVAGYVGCCAAIRDADFREELSSISVPMLIVCGTYDPVTTVADGHFLAAQIPGAKLVELSAAHLSNIEAASEFNLELLQFLTD